MSTNSDYLRSDNTPLALLLAIAGMVAFTPIFAAGKLSDGTVPVLVLVWLRYVGGAATILSVAAVKRVQLYSRVSGLWKFHVLRAFCGIGGLGCALYAASVLALADATAIGLTKGILAIVLAGLILKEVITSRHWAAGLFSVVGAYLIVRAVDSGEGTSVLATGGVVAALMGAVFMACEALIMRYIAQREDTVTILAYVNVIAAILLTGPVLWTIMVSGTALTAILTFAWMGPLAIAGQSLNISAYRRAGAATLAPAFYGTVVLSAVFGFVVWGEIPTPLAVLGAVLIVAGGAILTLPNPLKRIKPTG